MTILLTLAAFCRTCIQFQMDLHCFCPSRIRPICKINIFLLESIFETGRKSFLALHWSTGHRYTHTHIYTVTKHSIFIKKKKSARIFENSISAYITMCVYNKFLYTAWEILKKHSQKIRQLIGVQLTWQYFHLNYGKLILAMKIISGKKHGAHMWAQMP